MNEQLAIEPITDFTKVYQQHLNRKLAYGIVKQFFELLKFTQQHRAVSMAILEGDDFFRNLLPNIHSRVETLLKEIELQLDNSSQLYALPPFAELKNEWALLNSCWEKLKVIQTFEIHNHLIKKISALIWLIVEQSNYEKSNSQIDYLNHFIFREYVELLEAVAQIRGISTHLASTREKDPAMEELLNYTINRTKGLLLKAKGGLSQVSSPEADQILTFIGQNLCFIKMEGFIHEVPSILHSNEDYISKSQTCFKHGTQVLNAFLIVLNASVSVLEQTLPPELETWINNPRKLS